MSTSHPSIEILEEIGRGDFATVYRARDQNLKRYLAVKELHEDLRGDARQFQQFCAEARFLASLRHDNIVQVYGLDPDRGWILMELMRASLDGEIRQAGLGFDLVRGVLRQSLEGLRALHGKNKLHGAVKPANLLVDDAGRVKLSDSVGVPPDGEFRKPKGGWKYLAPELAAPEFGPTGPTLDLYGLGFTALELLKGPKFDGLFKGVGLNAAATDAEWMRWHASAAERLPAVATLVPGLPDDLAGVIDRLLVKEVAGRFADASAVLKALENRPIPLFNLQAAELPGPAPERRDAGRTAPPARTATTPQPDSPPLTHTTVAEDPSTMSANKKAKPARAAARPGTGTGTGGGTARDRANQQLSPAVVTLLGVLFFGAVGGYICYDQTSGRPARPHRADVKGPGPDEPRAATDDKGTTAAVPGGGDKGKGDNSTKRDEGPKTTQQPEPDRDKARPLGGADTPPPAPVVVTKAEPPVGAVASTEPAPTPPDVVADPGVPAVEATQAKLPAGVLREFKGHRDTVKALAFTPDGRRLASAGVDGTVRVWDVEKGAQLHLLKHPAPVYGVAVSRDGRRLLSAGKAGVRYWDLDTGDELPAPKHANSFAWGVTFLPHADDRALSAHVDRSVRLWDLGSGGEAIPPFRLHRGSVLCVAASPDGRRVASGDIDKAIRIWDVQTGEPARPPGRSADPDGDVLVGSEGYVYGVAFSPDGQELLSAGADGMVRHWDLRSFREVRQFGDLGGAIYAVAYAPLDRALTAGPDKVARLWDVRTGRLLAKFEGHKDQVHAVAVRGDDVGSRVATGGRGGELFLWDLDRRP